MNYQSIKFDVSDGQGRLTLNRPEKLNSFTTEMHAEIAHAIGRVSAGTDDVRVLVISGAGRAFCAGQDLSEGQMSGSGPVDLGETVERFYAPLVRSVQALSVPVVAAVNGVAAGAGANLALACDIVIAAKSATFLQPFTKLGLLPDTGGTHFLPRLVGSARAMGLALLAPRISAEQAADWGMIWKAVPDSDFADEVGALAAKLAKGPTVAFARTKRVLQASLGNELQAQLDLERDAMRDLGNTADYREGVAAFLTKREPTFKGR